MASSRPAALPRSRAPSLAEAEGWIGWRVDDLNGIPLGQVDQVVGDELGRAAWLVLGGFRLGDGRRYLVPAFDAVGGAGRVWSPHLRSQVSASVELAAEPGRPGGDTRLRAHYASARRRPAA